MLQEKDIEIKGAIIKLNEIERIYYTRIFSYRLNFLRLLISWKKYRFIVRPNKKELSAFSKNEINSVGIRNIYVWTVLINLRRGISSIQIR